MRMPSYCSNGGGYRSCSSYVAAEAGYNNLKQEQVKAVVEFVRGSDIFVSLPTGYSKSLIYGSLPEVIKRVQGRPQKTLIALVISPLQGQRKQFRIGQAIKCFRSLRSRILVISSTLIRLLHFMISKCRQPGK